LSGPANPAFLRYRADRAAGDLPAHEPGTTGFLPHPLDFPRLAGTKIFAGPVSLPASYDLRTLGRVSPVKNQFIPGPCWTFAVYGSLESCLLPGESWDFSENHMKNTHGFDLAHDGGGNQLMATAYLVRWDGPVREEDDPYDFRSDVSPAGLAPVKHVQETVWIPQRSGPADNDNIKYAVMTWGGLATAMYYADSFYNATNRSYRYSGESVTPNHMATIVGWDDSFAKEKFSPAAPGDGAFIVKNSVGPFWGENGFFYVSYHDTAIGLITVAFANAEETGNYAAVHQYDPLGLTDSIGFDTEPEPGLFANVFTAESDILVCAAGFYTSSTDSTYTLKIYDGRFNAVGAKLLATKSGTLPNAGYRTVALDTPVGIAAGSQFTVMVELLTPGWNRPIPIESPVAGYSSGAAAAAGQSWVSRNGVIWKDLTTMASHANDNVCLKAYSRPFAMTAPAISPEEGTYAGEVQVTIAPPISGTTVRYTTDGSDPTAASTAYRGPFTLSIPQGETCATVAVKAAAFKDGYPPGPVASAVYRLSFPGDINADGVLDVADILLCLRMALGFDRVQLSCADVNGDGTVDILDVIVIGGGAL